MSSSSKKRRKSSILGRISRVFNRKNDAELGGQEAEFRGGKETLDNDSRSDGVSGGDATLGSDENETRVTAVRDGSSSSAAAGGRERDDESASRPRESCKDVVAALKSENSGSSVAGDRHMSTKLAFLQRNNDDLDPIISRAGDNDKSRRDNEAKNPPDAACAMSRSRADGTGFASDTRASVAKERKVVSQVSSEDSDFSADSTEESFEESSEDETEHPLEPGRAQRYIKDEYFTKGKYITYFFLEMERQFSNPTEVYKMVHYHGTDCEKPGKEGIK